MDVCALADMIVPAAVQAGASQLGKGVMENILKLVCSGLQEASGRLFQKFVKNPDEVSDLERRRLNVELGELFSSNPALAKCVEELLKDAGLRVENLTISQQGSGNQAIQITGSHNQVMR